MTVLQRRDARGFEIGPFRKFVVGAALAVVGVAAAFGLSQVLDQDETTALVTTPAERNAIAQGQAQRAESMQRVDQALIERWRPAPESALEDELAAIRAQANTPNPAAIEQARGQAMVDHYTKQWQAAANTSETGPR